MTSPIKWSFSSLKQYLNCPKQYYEVKVKQKYPVKVTQQMLYGTVVHKALEDYAALGTPLAENYLRFKPVMDELQQIKGDHYYEYKMALTVDKLPCDFSFPDYWVRGIADRIVVSDTEAFVVDYKTGNDKYPDTKQLQLMALMVFAHFPRVEIVKAGLLFVTKNNFIAREYKKNYALQLWTMFEHDINRLRESFDKNSWPCNPTPLCGWCPVTECQFYKGQ